MDDPAVATDAVDPVDREVAGFQLVRDRRGGPAREPRCAPRVSTGSEEVLLGDDGETAGLEEEAGRERSFDPLDGRLPDDLGGSLQRAVAAADEHDPRAVGTRLARDALASSTGVPLGGPPARDPEIDPVA